jgi:lipid-A-disaccharide synthase
MSPDPVKLMLIAGEVSGDMHAARLVRALRRRLPGLQCFGIGGDEMRAAGVDVRVDARDMAVMGLSEVLRRYGFFRRVFFDMLRLAEERRPDAVILVDYPGFNLRFAERLHAMGIRTIYYICPQVWAWHRSRIPHMGRILDRLITIFPFEKDHFEGTGLQVDFVGHPLVGETQKAHAAPRGLLPWQGEPRVALLPGSRMHEVRRILPAMWRAARLLQEVRPGASFLVATPSARIEDEVRHTLVHTAGGPARWAVVTGQTRDVLRQADAGMVASGTATVEASLMRCPMAVIYRVGALTYLLGRLLVRVPSIGMVNIVAGRRVCPEFVQRAASPAAIAAALAPLTVRDSEPRRRMLEALDEVNAALGEGDTDERAADVVVEALSEKPRAAAPLS